MSHRRIIHLDLDAFFCSVEELLRPELRGKAIIVGADPEGRGVVAAASYPARRYGVHSAMPIGKAARLCPHAAFLPARHGEYQRWSRRVMDLIREYTPLVEPVSIDEAFIDLTGTELLWGPCEDLARRIQGRIREELGLPSSIGLASTKLVAKVASDLGKPMGLVVVPPGTEAEFLAPLPIERLWGVGPVTARALRALGISTIGELAGSPREALGARFGERAEVLRGRALGIDASPVIPHRDARSIGHERTFAEDEGDSKALERCLLSLSQGVARRLRGAGVQARTVTLKLRYSDFTTLTRSRTLPRPTDLEEDLQDAALGLFHGNWRSPRRVRLLGVIASNLIKGAAYQLDLFAEDRPPPGELDRALDALRRRYGRRIIQRASLWEPDGAPG